MKCKQAEWQRIFAMIKLYIGNKFLICFLLNKPINKSWKVGKRGRKLWNLEEKINLYWPFKVFPNSIFSDIIRQIPDPKVASLSNHRPGLLRSSLGRCWWRHDSSWVQWSRFSQLAKVERANFVYPHRRFFSPCKHKSTHNFSKH